MGLWPRSSGRILWQGDCIRLNPVGPASVGSRSRVLGPGKARKHSAYSAAYEKLWGPLGVYELRPWPFAATRSGRNNCTSTVSIVACQDIQARRCTDAVGDERHCIFDCPRFEELRQLHTGLFQDSHDTMRWWFMWHKDQKSVCALVLAIVKQTRTS